MTTLKLISSIKMEDVDRLDQVFATLTSTGWVVPDWLIELREYVFNRDSSKENHND